MHLILILDKSVVQIPHAFSQLSLVNWIGPQNETIIWSNTLENVENYGLEIIQIFVFYYVSFKDLNRARVVVFRLVPDLMIWW